MSQRPPYAGSSKPYPQVLPQYIEEQAAAAAAAAPPAAPTLSAASPTVGAAPASPTVANRIDANETSKLPGSSSTTSATTIPQDIPVDALGDIDLINRIKTWPREKQPFWFINWQQIQAHRGDANNPAQPVQTQPNSRSFFAG
nr:PREDICTED: uncharacterized protein LOC100880895 isoform X2 [Megachile rotundata]